MYKYLKLSVALFALYAANGIAQTTVTNANNGTTNAIPKYNGTASVTNSAIVDSSGKIGIGNASPAYKLDVSGDVNVPSGQAYRYNGVPMVTAVTSQADYFFGGSGNLTMTGSYNSASGLFALGNNTTGYNNVATGESALQFNTTGYYNTATGTGALVANTTGHQNTAAGEGALSANTSGTTNNAYGNSALSNITTGYGSVGIGVLAGSSTAAAGANQTSTWSIYIGNSTTALADGDTNEIVIGQSASGNGTNSVTLGNSAITKTVLRGNVGIGTTSPGALFSVGTSGQFQVNTSGAVSAPSLTLAAPLAPANGGTGTGSLSGLIKGNGSSAFSAAVADSDYQAPITLTTTGTSGAATFSGHVLNIPQYSGGGSYTFSTGLTNTSGTVKNDLSTGIAGGQTIYGGTGATDTLVLQGTTGNGTSTAPAIKLNVGNAGTTNALTVLNSGRVGIGTTSPLGPLDVSGNGGLVVSGANLDPAQSYSLTPFENTGRLLEGWNRNAGNGEIDFISNRGAGSVGGFNFYDYTNTGTLNLLTTFMGNGNVGIGTASPGEKLEVSGNVKISGGGSHIHFPDNTDQSTAWTGTLTGGDYAESMDVTGDREQYEPGDVLVLDPAHPGHVLKSSEGYSLAVAGVYSTKPGVVGRRQKIAKELATTEVPMAMVGVVPTKVSAENGAIKPGDVLVTSSKTGYAMKGTDRSLFAGAVIGKAMGSLDAGTGVIEALISVQ